MNSGDYLCVLTCQLKQSVCSPGVRLVLKPLSWDSSSKIRAVVVCTVLVSKVVSMHLYSICLSDLFEVRVCVRGESDYF